MNEKLSDSSESFNPPLDLESLTPSSSNSDRESNLHPNIHQDQKPEDPIDPFEVRWDGDDRENVQNLPKVRRWLYGVILSACGVVICISSSIYSMAVDLIMEDFGTSRTVTLLGITVFLLGMGWGPMFLSPISEFHGRRIVYISSFACMLPFQILAGFAPNIVALLIARFLAGLSGSVFLGVASGSFSDMFAKQDLMLPAMMYTLSPFLGPGLGPLIGGVIVHNTHYWRWTLHVVSIAVLVMLIVLIFVVPETFAPLLLKKKAKRLRKETGNDRYYAPIERSTKSLFETIFLSIKRPAQIFIFEPMLTLLCIYSGLILSLLYLFFVSYPYVFRTVYDFNEQQTGFAFIGLSVGCLLAGPTVIVNKRYVTRQIEKRGEYQPELQLPQTVIGAIIIPIGLFIFGWASRPSIHWMVTVISGGIINFGLIMAFNGIFVFTIDGYRLFAASAMACNGVVRSTLASVFPLFGLQMYENLGIEWASTLLALVCVAFIPMPVLLIKYGPVIRGKSRFAWKEAY